MLIFYAVACLFKQYTLVSVICIEANKLFGKDRPCIPYNVQSRRRCQDDTEVYVRLEEKLVWYMVGGG